MIITKANPVPENRLRTTLSLGMSVCIIRDTRESYTDYTTQAIRDLKIGQRGIVSFLLDGSESVGVTMDSMNDEVTGQSIQVSILRIHLVCSTTLVLALTYSVP